MNLTNLETAVLVAMSRCDFFQDVLTDETQWTEIECPGDEVSERFVEQGFRAQSLGGAVASLVKKGAVTVSWSPGDAGRPVKSRGISELYLKPDAVARMRRIVSQDRVNPLLRLAADHLARAQRRMGRAHSDLNSALEDTSRPALAGDAPERLAVIRSEAEAEALRRLHTAMTEASR